MSSPEDEEEQHLATRDALEATQAQINTYQTLLKDLPEIFERKFNERLQPILDRQHQLLQERELLLDRLHQHLPEGVPAPVAGALPPGPSDPTLSRRAWGRRFGWLVCVALLGGWIGVQMSHHLAKRPGSPSPGLRDGRGDPPGWEPQTTRGPAAAGPTPATPETAPE
jgi:anti-sigma factor RsiW